MATRIGTAFVEIRPDFSGFGDLVNRRLSRSLSRSGDDAGRDFGGSFVDGFQRRSSGIIAPLDDALDDFNVRLRTKIPAPEIPAPKINIPKELPAPKIKVPEIPAPKLPDLDLTETVRLDLRIEGAQAQAEQFRAQLASLKAEEPTLEVKAKIAKAIADLDRVEAKVADLSSRRAEVNVDVDSSAPGALAQMTSSVQGLFTALGGSGGGGLSGATTRVSAGFISFGSAAGPLAAILAGLAVTVGVALVGAFAALAASLAFAVAGVAALGAAIAGLLGPALGLAIAAGTRLAAVFEALKAGDAARDETSRKSLAGSQAMAAASAAQSSAARGLAEANRQLGQATSRAYREMADAAEAASDAIRGVTSAQLSLDRAQLSTERAVLELQKFRQEISATGEAFGSVFQKFTDVSVDTSGLRKALADANKASGNSLSAEQELDLRDKILAVREARQREKEAVDGVSDAITASARAQRLDNQFKREGIKASESYRSALKGVEAATLAVAQAQDTQGFSAAQVKAIDLTSKLTEREQQLLEAIQRVRTELRGAFKGATDAVFGGMLKALNRLPQLINPLRGAFTRMGEAWGKAIDLFSTELIKPRILNSLRAFIDGAAQIAGPITRGLVALLEIFLNIGKAALPFLIRGTRKVADQLKGWAAGTRNSKALSRTIGTLIGHLKTWLGVGAAVADVFLAFFQSAAKPGKSLAESIRSLAERTAAWLRSAEGQKEVRQFFADVLPLARDFVKLMLDLTKAMVAIARVIAPVLSLLKRVNDAALLVRDIIVGAFATAVGKAVAFLTGGISDAVRGLPSGAKTAGIRIITGLVSGVSSGAAQIATLLREAVRQGFVAVGAFITPMFERGKALAGKLRDGIKSLADSVISTMRGLITSGLDAISGLAERIRGVGRSIGGWIVDGIRSGLSALSSIGTTVINALISVLNRALGTVNGLIDKANKINPFKDIPKIELIEPLKRRMGGIIPGTGRGDKVPLLAEPLEFMIRRKIVTRFGPTVFADINEGRLDPTVGYLPGERPSVSTRPSKSNHMALGGVVTSALARVADDAPRTLNVTAPITVAGGSETFDPVDAGVKLVRVVEQRAGGGNRQDIN